MHQPSRHEMKCSGQWIPSTIGASSETTELGIALPRVQLGDFEGSQESWDCCSLSQPVSATVDDDEPVQPYGT